MTIPAEIAPRDDSGAQTLDRYEWQAAMAAADAFRLIAEDESGATYDSVFLLCEVHEDWIVVLDNDFELVSAKHRDLTRGPWATIFQICGDGGIAHLYGTWRTTLRSGRARLVTNAPLVGDLANLSELIRIARSPDSERTEPERGALREGAVLFCREVASVLGTQLPEAWRISIGTAKGDWECPDDFIDDFTVFLQRLTVDDDRPVRKHTLEAAPALWVEEILVRRGADTSLAREIWTAVHTLCRARMRAGGTRLDTPLHMIRDPVASKDLNLDRRVLNINDVLQTIEVALRNPGGFRNPSPRKTASRVQLKMADGGCAETSIERAEMLRLAYISRSRDVRDAQMTAEEFTEAEMRLMKLCDDLVAKHAGDTGAKWGAQYWASISEAIEDTTKYSSDLSLTSDLALGAVCELSNQCKVWFGPWFDVDERLALDG